MALTSFNAAEFMAFTLILIRISVILAVVPIFGSRLIPPQIRIALTMVMTFFLWTRINVDISYFPTSILGFIPLILGEVFIGLAMALLIRTIFAGVQLAGQYIGYQMGMAIANVMDPQTGTQVSILSEFSHVLALFMFLAFNGHYFIIKGLVESFELITPGHLFPNPAIFDLVSGAAAKMFIIAVKICAAPFVVLFFTKVSMGIIAKMVPQMNVLFVGLPLYIMIGLLIFALSLTFFPPILKKALADLDLSVLALLRAM
ncbi:MAG: flagellar biosynthetic protein FliR [Deltaproteobacteria bacterium]|nr:flagellar biosynthetic protein FliR [Deltaproteobacteria bacterium]MBW2084949.1 flagellar biosynthetic protein FliR [Deltaproteobacteria bacterium]